MFSFIRHYNYYIQAMSLCGHLLVLLLLIFKYELCNPFKLTVHYNIYNIYFFRPKVNIYWLYYCKALQWALKRCIFYYEPFKPQWKAFVDHCLTFLKDSTILVSLLKLILSETLRNVTAKFASNIPAMFDWFLLWLWSDGHHVRARHLAWKWLACGGAGLCLE